MNKEKKETQEKVLKGKAGIENIQIHSGNITRDFILHLPDHYDKNTPVLIAFHGMGSSAKFWIRHLNRLIQQEEFIGVYPQGLDRSWNTGSGWEPSKANDIKFTEDIIRWLSEKEILKDQAIYGLGMSNGAGMVYRLAEKREFFDGIAAIAANLRKDQQLSSINKGLSVIHLHGMQDSIVFFSGGQSRDVIINFISAHESIRSWAKAAGCDTIPQIDTLSDCVCFSYPQCFEDAKIKLFTFPKFGHNIPPYALNGLYNKIWQELSANE